MGAGDTPERPESELSFRSSNDPSIALAMQDEGEGRSSGARSGNTQEDPGLGSPRIEDWNPSVQNWLAAGQAEREAIKNLENKL